MEFVEAYERARFAGERSPVTAVEFGILMNLFAEVLRRMREMDPAVLGHEGDGGHALLRCEKDRGHSIPSFVFAHIP